MKHPGISIEVKDMVSGVSEFLTTPDNESNDIVFMYRPSDELPEGAILRDCGPDAFHRLCVSCLPDTAGRA